MHDANDQRHSIHNRLLSALPSAEFALIQPSLTAGSFEPGTMLARSGDAVKRCFFPNNGMVSLLCVTENGRSVEAGYTGYEGMVGISIFLGKNEMPYDALVQAPVDGFTADAHAVLKLFKLNGVFHNRVLRFVYVVLKQMSQTCVCNHFHTIEARLCRWLTVMCERSNNHRLRVTQEFLAHMLGVQRTSIGLVANSLQQTGSIRYSRGRVEILDLDRLRAGACDCYKIVTEEYRKLVNDGNVPAMSATRQTTNHR